jgi:hypothetical protein
MTPLPIFRHQVLVLKQNNQPDGMGGQTTKYIPVGTICAAIRQLSMGEMMRYEQLATTRMIKLTCWWPGDNSPLSLPTARLDWDGGRWGVVSIENVDQENKVAIITASWEEPGVRDG